MTGVLLRRGEERHRDTGENTRKEAEIVVMGLPAEEHQRLEETKNPPPERSEREHGPADMLISDL